jgi:protein involved in polysaccharide export with SLBB domain
MNKANQTQSTLNSMSQSVAQNNSRNAQVGTGDVVDMQQQRIQQLSNEAKNIKQQSQDNFAKSWDSLSATQQKNAISRNKALNDYITSR